MLVQQSQVQVDGAVSRCCQERLTAWGQLSVPGSAVCQGRVDFDWLLRRALLVQGKVKTVCCLYQNSEDICVCNTG